MILIDSNILLYSAILTFPQHRIAQSWLDAQLNGTARVGLPWSSLLAFARVATNPRIMSQPFSLKEAWEHVVAWLDCDTVWIPEPSERHREILGKLLAQPGIHGKLIPDAHLAALAIEHGLTICSADTDFARFAGLRWENPLVK